MVKNLTIRSKLIITATVPLVALGLLATVALALLAHTNSRMTELYNDRVVPLSQLKAVSDAYAVLVVDAVNKANVGLMEAGETLAAVREARALVTREWSAFMATTHTEREAQLAEQAQTAFQRLEPTLNELEAGLAGLSGDISGELTSQVERVYSQVDPVSAVIAELVDLQLDVAKRTHEASSALYTRLQFGFMAAVIAIAVVVALAGILTYRAVARPLQAIRDTVVVIGRDRDLTQRLELQSRDEFGVAAHALDHAFGTIRTAVAEVAQTMTQLASAAEELSAVSTQTDQNLKRQQGETEQVAAAMNEMTQTVQDVARNANEVAAAGNLASEEAQDGGDVIRGVISSIGELAQEIGKGTVIINRLEEQSREIGSILDVIRGVSEQTNLLALNAAIEAARAGDQGRGFAVVADEVRTLARRTHESTEDIQAKIERLQADTAQAVAAMQRGQAVADDNATAAERAAEALERITRAIRGIHDLTTQIASAAVQQGAVAEEINRNISTINTITGENSAGAAQTAASSEEVARLAAYTRSQVEQFKI